MVELYITSFSIIVFIPKNWAFYFWANPSYYKIVHKQKEDCGGSNKKKNRKKKRERISFPSNMQNCCITIVARKIIVIYSLLHWIDKCKNLINNNVIKN